MLDEDLRTRTRVGFAGLGNIGKPMARNLMGERFDLCVYDVAAEEVGKAIHLRNQCGVRRQILTSISITGTSISTPTTVASAAPEDSPKSIVAVAMATSKWFDAPIMAEGAASP